MGNWPALLLAPTLALTNLSIAYALVAPSCAHQTTLAPHALTVVVLLLCAWMTRAAWRNWAGARSMSRQAARDYVTDRPPFVALVACLVGALSCLAVLMQWLPLWVLSPCVG